jgi:hypothetical protein
MITTNICLKLDQPNSNGRIYPRRAFEAALLTARPAIQAGTMFGSTQPLDPAGYPLKITDATHVVRDITINEDGVVTAKVEFLATPKGKALFERITQDKLDPVTRGTGTLTEKDGVKYINDDYVLESIDFCEPGKAAWRPK